ncbi:MAG TPA: ABC transporter permease [Clostridia bacterium]|nr:ABC transporter permease [Clostridia bacterium]
MLKESIKMSWGNIIHNKMRSFLTVLGIVIGIASIIALISIVQGATSSITSQISALGADKLIIQAAGTPLKRGLNTQDLQKLSSLEYVSGVSPTVPGSSSIVFGKTVETGVSVQGRNDYYFRKNSDTIRAGRGINILDVNCKNRVAVIGSQIERDMFFGIQPIGRQLLVNGETYTIIGVLKAQSGFSTTSTNDAVLIPYTAAMSDLGVSTISSVEVYMSEPARSDEIISSINNVLNQAFNYHDNTFKVYNMQDIISALGNITGMMSLLLAGIASISLIVGGIGIMNMMLVSVTERTTEIGLRKALGAEPSRIQLQFLMESIFISLFGGIIGMVLGLLIAAAAAVLIGFPFPFSIWTVVLAVGFSSIVGVVFGFAPARKASRLNPIDALRHV